MKKLKLSHYGWAIFLALFFVVLYFLNTTLTYQKPGDAQIGVSYEKAKVTRILADSLQPDPEVPTIQLGTQSLELEILTGALRGKTIIANNFVGRIDNKPAKVGTKMVIASYDNFVTATVENYSRENIVYILIALFLFVVILFGKSKGLKSIFSLGFTLVCIIYLFIPLIINGMSPILASIMVVIISTSTTLIALNGWCKKTIVAGISCISCTMLAGVIAYVVGGITNLSTLNTKEAEDLLFISIDTTLQIKDLLFAGILIASLGAIMDTTMSIASAIAEMKELNPKIKESQLLKSAMNIGKDIMGTMTNTLILAFTGSSINIIIIFFMYNMPYLQLINLDLLVIEIVQGLSGSIAVVLSIPITALIASKLFSASELSKG